MIACIVTLVVLIVKLMRQLHYSKNAIYMAAELINGKTLASKHRAKIKATIDQRIQQKLRVPGLAVILIGDHPASQIYVAHKRRACHEAGILSKSIKRDAGIAQEDLLDIIESLNSDTEIDGILVQLPLPAHIDTNKVLEAINPGKDVDGFHAYNMGRLVQRRPLLRPCTPLGIMHMLDSIAYDCGGKDATIIGQSNIVGRPMLLELLMANATPTICHSRSRNLESKIRNADIVIAAIGKPEFIQGHWIKPGAIVIDVGMNRLENGKLAGDVAFATAHQRAAWITPVPGGVGPMTIAMLLNNTLQVCEASAC